MDRQPSQRKTSKGHCSQSLFFQGLQPGQWLVLEDLPSTFAHNEALLLCRVSRNEWMTWIPEHGEYLLAF